VRITTSLQGSLCTIARSASAPTARLSDIPHGPGTVTPEATPHWHWSLAACLWAYWHHDTTFFSPAQQLRVARGQHAIIM
jgi:hypothetical protein